MEECVVKGAMPFNLEAAKRGAQLVTRGGRKARFVAHVPEFGYSRRVLILIEGNEFTDEFCENGFFNKSHEPTGNDIFMAPPPAIERTIRVEEPPVPCLVQSQNGNVTRQVMVWRNRENYLVFADCKRSPEALREMRYKYSPDGKTWYSFEVIEHPSGLIGRKCAPAESTTQDKEL